MAKSTHSLSKSTLIRSIQCPKSLYLYKNAYNLRDIPDKSTQQRFDRGHRIGKLAHQLFPGGKDVSPANPFSYDSSIAATKLLIQQQFPVIYEATFKYNGIMAALDIFEIRDGKYYAYEVKSSLRISNTYLLDAAIQYYIITQSGIPLKDFQIVIVNNEYVYDGNMDVKKFFTPTSVLSEIQERLPFVKQSIEKAIDTLSLNAAPEIPIGVHCTKPYPCDFQGHCWKHIDKDSIWYLPGISMQEKSAWVERGIEKVNQIDLNSDLNDRQKTIIEAFQTQNEIIQFEKLNEFIRQINYPLYFFDIEAFQPAIPLFENTKPYERIPFLFSLHYKTDASTTIAHQEYISPVGEDDRINFIEAFLQATSKSGKILVFNTLMEKGMLNKLSHDFPHYGEALRERLDRIVDLEIPFKELYYYHPKQQGSFSLKAIGNAMLGEDEFQSSAIKDGETAMAVYNELFYQEDATYIKKQLDALCYYCRKDTYVLYRIFEALKKIGIDL